MKIKYEEKQELDICLEDRENYELSNKNIFLKGIKDGVPIALGYFAVSFTLGIAAKNIGFNALEAAIMSATMHASAGEFAVMTIIASNSGYIEMAITQIVVNLRYILMSCALSQKLKNDTSLIHRLFLSCFVTDEIFALDVTQKGYINPFYNYGMAIVASPGWVIGTALGVVFGNILPIKLVNSMNIALYGMFLAVIIPQAKRNKTIACIVGISMALSALVSYAPYVKEISSGSRIIILTIVIAGVAAYLHPINDEEDKEYESE